MVLANILRACFISSQVVSSSEAKSPERAMDDEDDSAIDLICILVNKDSIRTFEVATV